MVQRNLYEQSLERQAQAQAKRSERLANSRVNRRRARQKRPFQSQSNHSMRNSTRPQSQSDTRPHSANTAIRTRTRTRPLTSDSSSRNGPSSRNSSNLRNSSNAQSSPSANNLLRLFAQQRNMPSYSSGYQPQVGSQLSQNFTQPIGGGCNGSAPIIVQSSSVTKQKSRSSQNFMPMPSIQTGSLPVNRRVASRRGTPRR
jgi:hypothetical protein